MLIVGGGEQGRMSLQGVGKWPGDTFTVSLLDCLS